MRLTKKEKSELLKLHRKNCVFINPYNVCENTHKTCYGRCEVMKDWRTRMENY